MNPARRKRIAGVAQTVLINGPAQELALLDELEQAGIRRVESGELWEALTQHGIADLVDMEYVPRGWATSSSSADEDGRSQARSAAAPAVRPTRVSPRVASEIARLTKELRLTILPQEQRVGPVPAGWSRRAAELVDAVGDELREATRGLGLLDVSVEGGRRIGVTPTRAIVRFDAQGDMPVGEGSTVLVLIGEVHPQQFEADVLSIFGTEVTVSLPLDYPDASTARLRCDLTWLLALQQRRLREVANGAQGFNAVKAQLMTTAADDGPLRVIGAGPTPYEEGLNSQQQLAVRAGRSPHLTWLWGPPGTGKTTTVASLVASLVRTDRKRVLVVAPTNVAVDVALLAVLRRIGARTPGEVVRLGPPIDSRLISRGDGHVLVDEVAAARGHNVARRRVAAADQLEHTRARLKELKAEARQGRLPQATERKRFRLEAEIAELIELGRELDRLLGEVRRQVCREARVVAATMHQVLLDRLKALPFDVVIIDEASMVPTSLAAIVAGSTLGQVIVAGDFRQLPPVTRSSAAGVMRWLGRSPFEACGIDTAVQTGNPAAGLVALTEQHRMREPLAEVVSHAFYCESPLTTSASVQDRASLRRFDRLPRYPLVLIDTSELNSRVSRRQGQWSRLNVQHAQLIHALVSQRGVSDLDVALISPFAPQARLLAALADNEPLRASTVHRFQGSDADLVVFDAVDSVQSVGQLHPWFSQGDTGSDGARLLNVAASRAREQLVLLADMNRVYRQRHSCDAVGTFLRRMDQHAERLDWRAVISAAPPSVTMESSPLAACADALRAWDGPAELFVPDLDEVAINLLLGCLATRRLEGCTIWVSADSIGRAGLSSLERFGAIIRPLAPIRESLLITGDVVITASKSLLAMNAGTTLSTNDACLAEAVRRIVRRRSTKTSPGSGHVGERCGMCGRRTVRLERSGKRASAHEICLTCDGRRRR
jgi:hypothetical protein